MLRIVSTILTVLVACQLNGSAVAFDKPAKSWSIQPASALMQKYCVSCHNSDKHKGDIDLTVFKDRQSILKQRKLWQEVLRVLIEEEMPPKDPQPTDAERAQFANWVDQTINHIDWSKHRHAGHVTIPRLTRDEYNNTMRDLLGVDLQPGELFSKDGQGESGFNNDRDALFITPSLMEKYLAAADRALSAAMALSEHSTEHHLESEKMFMTETKETPKQFGEDFNGYVLNRGQMTLYDSVTFPHDGFYRFTIRARSTAGPTGARLRINDEFKADFVVPAMTPALYEANCFVEAGSHQVTFNIEKPKITKLTKQQRQQAKQKKKLPAPPTPKNSYTQLAKNAGTIVNRQSAANAPKYPRSGDESDEVARLIGRVDGTALSIQRPYEWLRLHGENGEPGQLKRFVGYVNDRQKELDKAKVKLAKELNISVEEVTKRFNEPNSGRLQDNSRLLAIAIRNMGAAIIKRMKPSATAKPGSVAIDWIEIRGPFGPESALPTSLVGMLKPDIDDGDARRLIRQFATQAFRRPVSDDEAVRLDSLFQESRQAGVPLRRSLKLALTAVLVSPNFLFRVEQGPGDVEFQLTDHQLASRLSYFLWMSLPDQTLMDLANQNKLNEPSVLKAQVKRMIADPRAREFVKAFTGQWLGYSAVGETLIPDRKLFKQYNQDLGQAMRLETILMFEMLLRDDGSGLELLDTDRTFVNTELAKHYDIKEITGNEMRLVKLENPNRGGLLGMASVLTATSSPTRTSPVVRGKWVLETLLGEEPGEPPADAGALPGNAGQKKGLTLRDELVEHRRNPSCAVCHDRIDPLGFGLENFDAIGRFRTQENNKPIDASGQLPDGTTFNGPAELKHYLLTYRRAEFLDNLARRMLSFSLGRKIQYYDTPAIEKITAAVSNDDHKLSTLVIEIVASYPFQHQSPLVDLPEIE